MNGLFILLGECFREAMPLIRTRDTEYGFIYQKQSSDSHIKLIDKLSNNGYKIDIAINTYITKYKEDLLSWYGDKVIYSNFTSENYGRNIVFDFSNVVNQSIKNVLNNVNIDKYDFIFICRNDLLLKDPLIDIFNPDVKSITYPNIMSLSSTPCISDTFCIIPKKYFYPFNNWKGLKENGQYILNPDSMRDLFLNGLSIDDIDFVSNKLYIANTYQSWNPLYKINCRDEADNIREDIRGLIYIKKINKIVKEEE